MFFLQNSCSEKLGNIQRKTLFLESLFNKVPTLKEKNPIQVPSQEYCLIFKNRFFQRTRLMENQVSDFSYVPELHFRNIFCRYTLLAVRVRRPLSTVIIWKKIIARHETITNGFVFNSFSGFGLDKTQRANS